MLYQIPIKQIFRRAGIASGKAYSLIRGFEKRVNEFDRGFGGLPGDIYRQTPLALTYAQTIQPAKRLLKAGEKVFGGLGEEEKINKRNVAEGLIETAHIISEGTNDFVERGLKSETFNNLFRSPYVQNYLNS